jgi:hypothetical protein
MCHMRRSFRRAILFIGILVALLIVVAGLASIQIARSTPGTSIDCYLRPPFVRPVYPEQVVFTSRILYVGGVDPKYGMRSGQRIGSWAIAYVKHHYWGLPWWSSGLVVLSLGQFEEGEDYFVDGNRNLSKVLPLVYVGPCNRTGRLRDAVLDLRILNAAPWHGVRVINRTLRRKGLGYELAPDLPVEIIGPGGSRLVTSDADSVYDVSGLPPGHYTFRLRNPDRRDQQEERDRDRYETLADGDVGGRPLYSK